MTALEALLNTAAFLGGLTAVLEIIERVTGAKLARGQVSVASTMREWLPRALGAGTFLLVSLGLWGSIFSHPWKSFVLWLFAIVAIPPISFVTAIRKWNTTSSYMSHYYGKPSPGGMGPAGAAFFLTVAAILGSLLIGIGMLIASAVLFDARLNTAFAFASLSTLVFSAVLLASSPRLAASLMMKSTIWD